VRGAAGSLPTGIKGLGLKSKDVSEEPQFFLLLEE
jgi:hypothetical protein